MSPRIRSSGWWRLASALALCPARRSLQARSGMRSRSSRLPTFPCRSTFGCSTARSPATYVGRWGPWCPLCRRGLSVRPRLNIRSRAKPVRPKSRTARQLRAAGPPHVPSPFQARSCPASRISVSSDRFLVPHDADTGATRANCAVHRPQRLRQDRTCEVEIFKPRGGRRGCQCVGTRLHEHMVRQREGAVT
jgi:hypothetical protein